MMNKSMNKLELNGVQVEVQVYILLFATALLDEWPVKKQSGHTEYL